MSPRWEFNHTCFTNLFTNVKCGGLHVFSVNCERRFSWIIKSGRQLLKQANWCLKDRNVPNVELIGKWSSMRMYLVCIVINEVYSWNI